MLSGVRVYDECRKRKTDDRKRQKDANSLVSQQGEIHEEYIKSEKVEKQSSQAFREYFS
jgi:hypothetical protein